jgi:importin subunit beta-1
MPFVTTNIGKNGGPEDWRWREAATFAFGSIMEGPSPASLVALVQQAMPFLLQVGAQPPAGRIGPLRFNKPYSAKWSPHLHALSRRQPTTNQPTNRPTHRPQAMKDPHPYVRDTTAWTVGRAFEFLHDTGNPDLPPLVTQDSLPPIVQVRGRSRPSCLLHDTTQPNPPTSTATTNRHPQPPPTARS